MAKICTNCGSELGEGAAFCTECGTPVPAENAPAPQPAPPAPPAETAAPAADEYRPETPQAPVYAPPAPVQAPPVYAAADDAAEKHDVVSTGSFFGLMFLYAIPVIGWIICLIYAFASKSKNKRNFSRAWLIWLLIGLVFAAIVFLLFRWIGRVASDIVNGLMDNGLGDLIDQIGEFR